MAPVFLNTEGIQCESIINGLEGWIKALMQRAESPRKVVRDSRMSPGFGLYTGKLALRRTNRVGPRSVPSDVRIRWFLLRGGK